MSKREVLEKIICEEVFNQLLQGKEIINCSGKKNRLRIIQTKNTKEFLESDEKKIFSDKVGFHYEFNLGISNDIRFLATDEQMNKLEELVKQGKSFPLCQ